MRAFIAACIACIMALLVALAAWRFMYGEVFSDSIRARLRPGMTTNEVVAILGPPSWSSSGHWEYTRPFMGNVGLVFFDESGHFRQAIND
jgi:outer membrane protein assembly factor BamE (lipoprotein component of BamABCDE complex)